MQVRKPLERTVPLRTTRPLRRTRRLRSSGPIKPKRTGTGPTPDAEEIVRNRFEGRCARCGVIGHSVHHRIPRQAGGTSDPTINRLSNLVWLCGDGVALCHGEVESHRSQARADGYLVRRRDDPSTVPIRLWDGRRVLLDDTGGVTFVAEGGEVDVA